MMIQFLILVLLPHCSGFHVSHVPPIPLGLGSTKTAHEVTTTSETLGKLSPLKVPGQDDFLGATGVLTYKSTGGNIICDQKTVKYGLEGALGRHGPAFVVDNILSRVACRNIIGECDAAGFGNFKAGKNHHGALQVVVSQEMCNTISQALCRHVDLSKVEERRREMESDDNNNNNNNVRLEYAGLNRRWRVYKYAPNSSENFAPHIDAGFPPSSIQNNELLFDASGNATIVSRLTILFYLNDDFQGGETNFYLPFSESSGELSLMASVRPVAGLCLVFPQGVGEEAVAAARTQWPLHEGSPVKSGNPKYVIRSDILFRETQIAVESDRLMFRYDHLVRDTFLPQSIVLDNSFLRHLDSLYNPHMGVENLGPFLYSFVRFTKRRRIVEIGSGYTSPWILQALKDNDDELSRIRDLQIEGKCKLLDYPWTVADFVERFDDVPASLLAVDNCEHQKETATGAVAVSKSLGLEEYMKFLVGEAFDLDLESESVDILWCDFGVGSRMKDFAASAWASIADGGFLLCHSTLTNRHTREWLEAVRQRAGEEITGMPVGEYSEVSFLEPHKHFQNSITIIQKRKQYAEPLFSEYA